jgi:asparagine synthetase B (glutamine-hydrolysing)
LIDTSVDRLDDGGLVWFAAGASKVLKSSASSTVDPVELGMRLVRDDRDASFALVDQRDPRSPVLHLWRGLLSPHDWFFAERSDGRTIVSDDFRSTLAALPVAERSPGDDGVVQHYLFRTVFGTDTYVQRIARVGSGEHVAIDVAHGKRTPEIVDRISSESDLVAPERYVSVIEDALTGIMADLGARQGIRLLFSGGVDSTLLATFLSQDHHLLTVVPDTPEFEVETAYARESAQLLGMQIEELTVAESSYVELLETTIDNTGRPPMHDIVPFLAAPYAASPGASFLVGEGADSIYGTGGRAAKIANLFRDRRLRAGALGLARATPQQFRTRAESVIGRGRHLAADPLSADGFGATSQVYGDPSFITSIVGAESIEGILLSDLAYVLDRVDLVGPNDQFLQHIELAQWRDAFADHIRIDNEAARIHGSEVRAPFTMSSTISALTRIPVAERCIKGFTGKWLMKEMLSARLPSYEVGRRKWHTSLPFTRYCTDGPLTGIWERYPPPQIFEGQARRDLVDNKLDEAVMWNAIAYAIWDERVVRNQNLTPHPSKESISVDVGGARG